VLQLLTEMSPERLTELYESLDARAQRALDDPISKALNSRPQTVAKRPLGMRMKALRAHLMRTRDDDLAGELIRAYLLGARKELVTDFLGGVGIEHEDGTVEGDDAPDEAKVASTVETLLSKHAAADVQLYLEVAAMQWPESKSVVAARDAGRSTAS
jgi:hypothetical protein